MVIGVTKKNIWYFNSYNVKFYFLGSVMDIIDLSRVERWAGSGGIVMV
jgi:hypothetical protein